MGRTDFSVDGVAGGELSANGLMTNPAMRGATLYIELGSNMMLPYLYNGLRRETGAYRKTAWIGTPLMLSPIYDVVGPDACAFLQSICVNDFSKLKYKGLRHAIICNEKGQELTDGVVIRIAEDRYRTYWLNPPIQYLLEKSGFDVHGEDMTGKEYFIQIEGEKSLEILEDAFQQDLHDIRFAKRRVVDMDGRKVNVIRLGMCGGLAYEIHGPMDDYAYVYDKVWESGEKFGAEKEGMLAYNEFNHTEAGFSNIHQHYPLPWFETSDDMTKWMYDHPSLSMYNINRKLVGSSTDLQERFVTPYDMGWGFLVKFNHDFIGREALEAMADKPARTAVTLEWNPEDVGKIFAAMNTRGGQEVDDISKDSDLDIVGNNVDGVYYYRADEVYSGNRKVGITSGRIHTYNYNAMISIAYVEPGVIKLGDELRILWGTPGTKQMWVRAKVCPLPYNDDIVTNDKFDVETIPHRFA